MANTDRAATARRIAKNVRSDNRVYVEGNAARRLQEIPDRRAYPANKPSVKRNRAQEQTSEMRIRQPRQLSREVQRNREKALSMNRGFVLFLAAVSVAILFFCINYLQLKSEITGRMNIVAALESELTQLKEDNDAYYSQVTSNVDLSKIKKIAIGRLGMNYPSDDQTMTYQTQGNSYVRQYQDIPNSK